MTQRERSREVRQKWQRLVSEQGRSGQSVAPFVGSGRWSRHVSSGGRSGYGAVPERRQTPLTKILEVKLILAVLEHVGVGPASTAEVLALSGIIRS